MGEEEEGGEAELLVRFDLLREACVDGGVRRRPRLGHRHGAGRLWFPATGGEKEGKEEQHVEGGLFTLHGGPGARRRQGTPRRHGGNGASVSHDATGGRDDRWVPLSGIC